MDSSASVMVLALDAADPGLVREMAARGELPAIASFMREAAAVDTVAPMGVFVSANWPTISNATWPDRHGFLCWEEFRGGTYDYHETDPLEVHGTPLWKTASDAGRRVAVLDVPHSKVEPLNGAMLAEWGCHDRHYGPASWPLDLAAELSARHGAHFGTADPPGRDQFAPCDYIHRAGAERTDAEALALFGDICRGLESKRGASLDLLDRGGWDLFLTVLGESHCVGHQLWQFHDPAHPRHDESLARRMGGDPVAEVYRRLDRVVGEHLERLGPEATAYLLLPHGMAAHHDGTHLLDQVLHRLDWGLDEPSGLGRPTRLAAEIAHWIPQPVRGPALRLSAPLVRSHAGDAAEYAALPAPADRRWFMAPNNSVVGAVRLNLAGREPAGRLHPSDRRRALSWLAKRLGELVNLDTGGRVVRRCVVTDDVYRRAPGDAFGDLYVEWERSAPIERVWSPATGTVVVPYTHWRQGDHVREGAIFGRGPGIRAGRRRGRFDTVDVGATIAAAIGVELPGADGIPIPSLLPDGRAGVARRRGAAGRVDRALRRRAERRVPGWAQRHDPAVDRLRSDVDAGLQGAAARDDSLAADAAETAGRVEHLERQADLATMTRWLEAAPVADDLLISVVLPTCNRRPLLEEAIASVQAQSYQRWELVVVDDDSTDGTAEFLAASNDPRVRAVDNRGRGHAAACNTALELLHGDVVVHLDDDNRFDRHWLKAVAATFGALPGTTVAYGARICDDHGRVHRGESSGRPWLQFRGWDAEAMRAFNIADMNVLAHRPSEIRLDEALSYFTDWDLFLHLTRDVTPVEIPAVAAYYRTDVEDRMTDRVPQERKQRDYETIRRKFEASAST